jgi:hypothetical protein
MLLCSKEEHFVDSSLINVTGLINLHRNEGKKGILQITFVSNS